MTDPILATFIVPYIQIVFSLESVGRALRRNPFPPPPRWTTPGCILIVVLGLVGISIATIMDGPPNTCFADLFWFAQHWRTVSFGVTVSITGALLICAIIMFVRLRQSMGVSQTNQERQAASNMVYYMVLAMISNVSFPSPSPCPSMVYGQLTYIPGPHNTVLCQNQLRGRGGVGYAGSRGSHDCFRRCQLVGNYDGWPVPVPSRQYTICCRD